MAKNGPGLLESLGDEYLIPYKPNVSTIDLMADYMREIWGTNTLKVKTNSVIIRSI